jgi:hypothetical protein
VLSTAKVLCADVVCVQVDPGSVMDVYAASVELGVEPPAMLYDAAVAEKLTGAVRAKQEAKAAAGRDEDD